MSVYRTIGPLVWVLLRLLYMILTKTAFKFNDGFYEQISGITMGTICAPSLAIIFMDKLEVDFLATSLHTPLVWWRYIDDIFMIWPHSVNELYSFLSGLNQFHTSIKFTYDMSQTQVNFLDVLVTKDKDGHLATSLYTKPTDTHMYLHYDSFHPIQQKKSIPYSQAVRLRRICSTTDKYWEAANTLQQNLTARGYPKHLIKNALERAFLLDRSVLLRTKPTNAGKHTNLIPFVTTYNPYNPPIGKILRNNKHILSSSGELEILQRSQFLVVNKRALSIRQQLVRTDINPVIIPTGSGPCNTPCKTCPFMKPSTSIICWTTKEKIQIEGRFNCKSKNVVYLLTCSKCGLQYVGQSGNTFNERFRAHLTDIKQGNVIKPISRHFTSTNHTADDVLATILMQTTGNINIRLRTEETWIHKLKTRSPQGLNLIQ